MCNYAMNTAYSVSCSITEMTYRIPFLQRKHPVKRLHSPPIVSVQKPPFHSHTKRLKFQIPTIARAIRAYRQIAVKRAHHVQLQNENHKRLKLN